MKLTPDQIKSRTKIGKLDDKPVFLIETYGGYNVVESNNEPIGLGSNSAIAKSAARKAHSDIKFDETSQLSKSMDKSPKDILKSLLSGLKAKAKPKAMEKKVDDPNSTQVVKPQTNPEMFKPVESPDIKVRSWADEKPKQKMSTPGSAKFRTEGVALAYRNAMSKNPIARSLARSKLKETPKEERAGHRAVIRADDKGAFKPAKPGK